MTYSPLDDRPNRCEGCNVPDYPAANGPSAKQMTWNNLVSLWLCVDCQFNWSNWHSGTTARKPAFLEMGRGTSIQGKC